jgi:hypothetical protein
MRKHLQSVFLLLVTCFCSTSFAGEDSADVRNAFSFDSKEPLFVSLGSDCGMAGQVENIGYRRASFPFDWLLTFDHNGMLKVLDDNFKHFLNPSCYSLHTNGALVNTYYHFEFRHEHDNDFIGKYARRIDRFRKLNNYSGKVFFMRESFGGADHPSVYWPSKDLIHISFEHAQELKQVLKKRFPDLNFTLVILNFCGNRTEWEITDDIVMISVGGKNDYLDLLLRLLQALGKCAEDPLAFGEEFFLDDPE